jgi:hypothetical protein
MGAFTPYFPNAKFAKPLPSQIIAIIQRDQAGALANINTARAALGSPPLQPITEFHKGMGARYQPPWLLILVNLNVFKTDSYPTVRDQAVQVVLVLDVGQFDQEMAQDNALDYMTMLDQIMTTAGFADWVTALPITHETVPSGTTAPGEVGTVKSVMPESMELEVVEVQEVTAPLLQATLRYTFLLSEF